MSRMSSIHVLRIGHRLVRDDRSTTHICLVARAFGADKVYVVGGDSKVVKIIEDVNRRWGGDFKVDVVDEWRGILKRWRAEGGVVVHLTMYGLNIDEVIDRIRESDRDILVVVGAEKVPRELYTLSDFNVAVGSQPHSEVAALAVFLDRLFRGEELKRGYNKSMYRIVPSERGKRVEVSR